MKKISIIALGFLVVPQMALASWWNPLSWKVLNRVNIVTLPQENWKKETEGSVSKATVTTSTSTLEVNKKSVTPQKSQPPTSTSSTLQPKKTLFTLPSGAVVDESGKILNQAEIEAKNALFAQQQMQLEQQKKTTEQIQRILQGIQQNTQQIQQNTTPIPTVTLQAPIVKELRFATDFIQNDCFENKDGTICRVYIKYLENGVWNRNTEIKVISSDTGGRFYCRGNPEINCVYIQSEKDRLDYFLYRPEMLGFATLTATANGIKATAKVTWQMEKCSGFKTDCNK